jgi:hypothetical protein
MEKKVENERIKPNQQLNPETAVQKKNRRFLYLIVSAYC